MKDCFLSLQIKRLNTEIDTLGANLTEVMQKENDTANKVRYYGSHQPTEGIQIP